MFIDRIEAAQKLAEKLNFYRDKHPLVLGIPRGSLPIAQVIATQLQGELDVILVHKIGAPDNPEFAIGSVSEFGALYLSEAAKELPISWEWIQKRAAYEIAQLKQKRHSYTPIRSPISPANRIVILTDDGIATGSTMLAAIRAIRPQHPKKLIVASPVASESALKLLNSEVDEMIILDTPQDFFSISQFYENFPQVSDEEVLKILSQFRT